MDNASAQPQAQRSAGQYRSPFTLITGFVAMLRKQAGAGSDLDADLAMCLRRAEDLYENDETWRETMADVSKIIAGQLGIQGNEGEHYDLFCLLAAVDNVLGATVRQAIAVSGQDSDNSNLVADFLGASFSYHLRQALSSNARRGSLTELVGRLFGPQAEDDEGQEAPESTGDSEEDRPGQ